MTPRVSLSMIVARSRDFPSRARPRDTELEKNPEWALPVKELHIRA